MQIEILTMFPGEFLGYLRQPHVAEVRRSGQLTVRAHNYCLWTSSEFSSVSSVSVSDAVAVDARTNAVAACLDHVIDPEQRTRVAVLSTGDGHRLDPPGVRSLFAAEQVVLICGGDSRVDRKIAEHIAVDVFSTNGNILATSESAAMSAIDAAVWLLSKDSLESSSGRGSHPHFAHLQASETQRLAPFAYKDIER